MNDNHRIFNKQYFLYNNSNIYFFTLSILKIIDTII